MLAMPWIATGVFVYQSFISSSKNWGPFVIAQSFMSYSVFSVLTLLISGFLIDKFSSRKLLIYMNLPFLLSLLLIIVFDNPIVSFLFLGLIGIGAIVLLVFLPNLETEEFSQEVIDDIVDGVTTTTLLEPEDNNSSKVQATENLENQLIISTKDKSQIEEILLYNNFEEELDNFDAYLLIGSDERSKKLPKQEEMWRVKEQM